MACCKWICTKCHSFGCTVQSKICATITDLFSDIPEFTQKMANGSVAPNWQLLCKSPQGKGKNLKLISHLKGKNVKFEDLVLCVYFSHYHCEHTNRSTSRYSWLCRLEIRTSCSHLQGMRSQAQNRALLSLTLE
ncbi:hypothetical protein K439DRAFT_1149244 [Ramaria rubella]|nr:hypothetical protein K439DRAFT_1149244 [Ramaria rubella]